MEVRGNRAGPGQESGQEGDGNKGGPGAVLSTLQRGEDRGASFVQQSANQDAV